MQGTGAIGDAEIATNVVLQVVGNRATLTLGDIDVTINMRVQVTSVTATAELGRLLVWQDIDDSQTPNWVDVYDKQ